MFSFLFRSPRLVFGQGSIANLPDECKKFGSKGCVVMGRSFKASKAWAGLEGDLSASGFDVEVVVRKGGEPTVQEVDALVEELAPKSLDWVAGIGGGSTIDLAKAVAGIIVNGGSARDYQARAVMTRPGIPFIAVPTTAGTGAEITNNSVLIDDESRVKKSIRGDVMLAKVAILDPMLTVSMPPTVTAHTGMDALTQAIESYVSRASNVMSDMFAEQAIVYILGNIEGAWRDGKNIEARTGMLYGSMLAALSFSNAKLGAVHGFAHPIGVLHDVPHGLACGVLLPHVMRFNLEGGIQAVEEKYAWIGRQVLHVSGSSNLSNKELAMAAIDEIFRLLDAMSMPKTLSGLGIKKDDIPAIVADTKGSSLENNPRGTDPTLLASILEAAL